MDSMRDYPGSQPAGTSGGVAVERSVSIKTPDLFAAVEAWANRSQARAVGTMPTIRAF
jgi:hypothetical protein